MCIVGVIITFQTIVQHANYCFPEHNAAISKSVQNPKHSVYCNKWQKEANPHIWEVATGESFIFFFFSSLFLCLFIFKAITIKFHDYSVIFCNHYVVVYSKTIKTISLFNDYLRQRDPIETHLLKPEWDLLLLITWLCQGTHPQQLTAAIYKSQVKLHLQFV